MKTELTANDPAGWYLTRIYGLAANFFVIWWDQNKVRHGMSTLNQKCLDGFRRLYTEEEVAELRTSEGYAIQRIAELEVQLEDAKAQPYPMRKADKPDCVGLWKANNGFYYEFSTERCISEGNWMSSPYYYLGPIPVIPKEQQPPKVVTIKNHKTGETHRAIPRGKAFCVLDDDGTLSALTSTDGSWEVIQ